MLDLQLPHYLKAFYVYHDWQLLFQKLPSTVFPPLSFLCLCIYLAVAILLVNEKKDIVYRSSYIKLPSLMHCIISGTVLG